MRELANCPFCGGEAAISDDEHHSTAVFYGCADSDCAGWMLWAETRAEAIAAWNRRTPVAADPALRTEARGGNYRPLTAPPSPDAPRPRPTDE
ncbi:Lar family restriction alleviation protein [Cereibacter azotoformans]|uniref:Lar family restriction alleviation protein n=1 Tax=Cereibacter azotoformans TaxID=43057 RepID=UPI000E360356|nr:Lar family restriction alleviation protein [Cereibacter azotoformans]AXQ93164.1 restriction alleviation protein, Lar family [Cereibacter sphaeroides]UIJ31474.1 Lar family restriction alleviation protein [Cereibacter azotoformans]